MATNEAEATGEDLAEVHWETGDGLQLRRLPQRVPITATQSLQLGLRTRGPNGLGTARLIVDYLEARLRYRSVRQTEMACDDGVDDDLDDAIDCGDEDCAEAPHCELEGETSCGDGHDNDGDTLADCADPGCAGIAPCDPGPESACDDGHDNDADGLTDCLDEDCAASACPGQDPCEGLDCGAAQGQDCGSCAQGLVCVEGIHRCVAACEPACAGKTCGDDGCGGQCGPGCEGEASCDEGVCVCPTECTGWPGSDDGCGGQCGVPDDDSCPGTEEMHPEGYCSDDYVLQFTPLAPAPIVSNTIGVNVSSIGAFARKFAAPAQSPSILRGIRIALATGDGLSPDGRSLTAFAIRAENTLIAPVHPSPVVFNGVAVPFLVLPPLTVKHEFLEMYFSSGAYASTDAVVVQDADGTATFSLPSMLLEGDDEVILGFYSSMGLGCRMRQVGYEPMEHFVAGMLIQDLTYTPMRDVAYGIGTAAPGQLQIAAGFVCWPNCEGRECGDDGCGGSCGDPCADGLFCSDLGQCFESVCGVCAPGTVCGADPSQPLLCAADPAAGCGETTEAGACQDTVRSFCQDGTLYSHDCQLSGEECHGWTEPASCGAPCDPSCDDLECGLDGCGQPCGGCLETHTCVQGLCYNCQPECADRECGGDTCFSVCGTCEETESCYAGRCWPDCEPTCPPGACGGDGCGGTCGTCDLSETCDEGQCVPNLCGGQCGGEALDGTCLCDSDCLWDGTCCADVCHSCGGDLEDPYACTPQGKSCWEYIVCKSDCPSGDGYTECKNACLMTIAIESYHTYMAWEDCLDEAEECSTWDLGIEGAEVCEYQVCKAERSACQWEETGPSACAEILGCQLNCTLPGGCGPEVCNQGGDWEAQGLALAAISCGNDVQNGSLSATDCATVLETCQADIVGSTCGTCSAGTVCAADPEHPERCMGEGCGAVGAEGVCEGKVRVYCEDGALYSMDCGVGGEACEVVDGVAACVEICDPTCDDVQCGLDGCGNPCGDCAEDHTCILGACYDCTLDCAHRECGSDGCLSTCGTCDDDETCWSGRCWPDCVPTCKPGGCGSDGCGGTCGECALGETCQEGTCWPNACEGQCGGTGLGGCLCDADCLWDGNCCPDNCATCSATFEVPTDCEPPGLNCDGLVSCYLNDCPDGPGYDACVDDCYDSTSVEGYLEHDDWLDCLGATSCAEGDAMCAVQRCAQEKGSCWYDDYGPSSCGEILGCHLGCELPSGCAAMCNSSGDANATGKALPTVNCGNDMGNGLYDAADCAPIFDACLQDVVGEP
ncbi:MAG: hypothetical protein VYE81_11260 [Planctomycetota bacterium]|nr:hypothetical protein [Planctomycetota bacterium]